MNTIIAMHQCIKDSFPDSRNRIIRTIFAFSCFWVDNRFNSHIPVNKLYCTIKHFCYISFNSLIIQKSFSHIPNFTYFITRYNCCYNT